MIANLSQNSPAARPLAGSKAGWGLVTHLVNVATTWWRAHSDRRRLSSMSEEMLRDVGLSRADVEREFQRPFWEPIDYQSLDEQREITARRSTLGLP